MKIIGTLLLALIPGILSSDTPEVRQAIRLSCAKNGGPKAYENVEIAANNLLNVIVFAATEIVKENNNNSGGIDAAFMVYCGRVGILQGYIDSFLEALLPCLNPGDCEFEGLSNFTTLLLQFPCANKDLVKDVLNMTNQPCSNSKLENLAVCGQDILAGRITTLSNITSAGNNSNETKLQELESDSEDPTCREVLSFQQCTVSVLAECEDQIYSRTLDTLYKHVNNDLPCGNLPKSPK